MSESIYFCGTVRAHAALGVEAMWKKRELSYYVSGSLPSVTPQLFIETVEKGCAQWAAVTPLTFRPAGPGSRPDLVITAGKIDGPGGVLAWSELPDGSDRQLTQKYDASERYVVAEHPAQGQVDLLAVVTHELGHALGLDHASQNSGDLMAPTYVPGRRAPKQGDVKRIQDLYGPPTTPRPGPSEGYWTVVLKVDKKTGATTIASVA